MRLNNMLDSLHIILPALLLALTFHEFAHAKVADLLGDQTARRSGRLTLNPVEHLDPMGLLMMVFVGFGWARPVPINPFNFKGDRHRGILLVSIAGPLANLTFAFFSFFLYYLAALGMFGVASSYLYSFTFYLITYNVYLMLFNLIPVPPLDGSKVLSSLLPQNMRYKYEQIEPYAPFILIILLITGALPMFLRPMANSVIGVLQSITFSIFQIFL